MQKPGRVAAYLESIGALAPLVAQCRLSFDHERRLTDSIFDALADAGLFRLWLPEALGGPQLSPLEFMTVVEAAASLDGSIGWLVGNGGGMSRAGAFVPETTARTWFSEPRAFIAAATGAVGEAVPVDGGYLVSGRWPFGSGAHHATIFMGLATMTSPDGGEAQLSCYLERRDVLIQDTWHVSGLRGTGSCHFEAQRAFVPGHRTHDSTSPKPYQSGLIYRLPVPPMFAWTVAVVPLGIARGAIDAFIELAATRRRQRTTAMLRDRETVQAAVGRADAMYGAARAFLIEAMMELMETSENGDGPSIRARAVFRAACTNAAESAVRIVELLAREAGAASIFESCPLERAARDIHAASHHVAMSHENYIALGRASLGLDAVAART
jgi:alkylation response protein AidB-like acyl-CoA dehydrogenase